MGYKNNIYYMLIGALSALIVGFALSAMGFFSGESKLWGGLWVTGAVASTVALIIVIIVKQKYFKSSKSQSSSKNSADTEGTELEDQ